MGYMCFCTNKGCNKEMEPVVDKDTLVAYCTECGKPIDNITLFMKRQLVSQGQVKKAEKKRLLGSVQCNKCKEVGPPELSKDNKFVCPACKAELNLNKPFEQMLRLNLQAIKRAEG